MTMHGLFVDRMELWLRVPAEVLDRDPRTGLLVLYRQSEEPALAGGVPHRVRGKLGRYEGDVVGAGMTVEVSPEPSTRGSDTALITGKRRSVSVHAASVVCAR